MHSKSWIETINKPQQWQFIQSESVQHWSWSKFLENLDVTEWSGTSHGTFNCIFLRTFLIQCLYNGTEWQLTIDVNDIISINDKVDTIHHQWMSMCHTWKKDTTFQQHENELWHIVQCELFPLITITCRWWWFRFFFSFFSINIYSHQSV